MVLGTGQVSDSGQLGPCRVYDQQYVFRQRRVYDQQYVFVGWASAVCRVAWLQWIFLPLLGKALSAQTDLPAATCRSSLPSRTRALRSDFDVVFDLVVIARAFRLARLRFHALGAGRFSDTLWWAVGSTALG